MFLSLLLSVKIFKYILTNENKNFLALASLSFFSLYSFILLITPLDEYFTFIEVFAIFLAVWSSMKRKRLLFFISIVVGVSNRESGLVLGIIYVLLNYRNMHILEIALYITAPVALFSIINYDILEGFYQIMFYTSTIGGSPSLLNYTTLSDKPVGELINYMFVYVSYLAPIGYLIVKLKSCALLQWSKLSISIYLFIILFGSFLGNFMLLLLIIPFYQILIALYLNESY
jgi:hypothetical protein